MSPDLQALGLRWMACEGFEWRDGMLVTQGKNQWKRLDLYQVRTDIKTWILTVDPPHPLPDLSDPATLGCLLADVRRVWGNPLLSLTWHDEGCSDPGRGWSFAWGQICGEPSRPRGTWLSEPEALICAREAAP